MTSLRHAASLALLFTCAGAACAADLTIRVDDVRSAQGSILVAVYSADGFLKRPLKTAQVAAAAGQVQVLIQDLPAGDYGFALFHDANGNGKLDSNAMGIPVEDHAFSNNARGNMGPPTFAQVKFGLPAAGALAVTSLR